MGGGLLSEPAPEKSYTEIFNENFPFYLSIGMSSAEYWDGDPSLARYFREAYRLRQEQDDHKAWQQGLYIYEGLTAALSNMFRKKGSVAASYPSLPYLQKDKEDKKAEAEGKPDKFEIWMNQLVSNGKNSVHSI